MTQNKPLHPEVNDIENSEISEFNQNIKAINTNKELFQSCNKTLNDERENNFRNQNETLNLIGNALKYMVDLSIVNDKVQSVPRLKCHMVRHKDGSGLSIFSNFVKKVERFDEQFRKNIIFNQCNSTLISALGSDHFIKSSDFQVIKDKLFKLIPEKCEIERLNDLRQKILAGQ